MSRIEKRHLERAACIYVRQSTMTQVQNNLESQRRQYGLADRAKDLGWQEVRVVDEDLGRSGSGHVERRGFEALLAQVCQGEVGAVFAVEASRLARNGHEWHRLLEFCGIVDTLIVDHDGIYDPKHPNDRLLLGLKGTMSEMEVAAFRQRSREAIRQKAGRGEFYTRIAEGYVLPDDGCLEKDPDEQVQKAIELTFAKFRDLGSARQVFLWFRQQKVLLPKRLKGKAPTVEFATPTPWLIARILKDPAYAGAYAYGRTKQRVILENERKRVVTHRRSRPEDWEVLIRDHHEAYISWQDYLHNLETLAQNQSKLGDAVRGPARRGKGLLAGLVRCGHCGRKMRVQYGGGHSRTSAAVYYLCSALQRTQTDKSICSLFGGVSVERAVTEAVLNALSPLRIEAMVRAADGLSRKRTEKRQQIEFELQRSRYQAGRYERQYSSVEPENRLVARSLESRWNLALERVSELERELCDEADEAGSARSLSGEEEEQLRSLGTDLPRLWNHPAAPFELKKRILRAVIQEIVVYVGERTLRVLLHWKGGEHTELTIRKRKSGEHRWKTCDDTLKLICDLARQMPDTKIAAQLNRMGIKSSKGHTWTRTRVGNFRKANRIPNHKPGERQERRELNIQEAAEQLGVSYSKVERMIRHKQLPARQACRGAPWTIRAEEIDALQADGSRQERPSSASSNQTNPLFPDRI